MTTCVLVVPKFVIIVVLDTSRHGEKNAADFVVNGTKVGQLITVYLANLGAVPICAYIYA